MTKRKLISETIFGLKRDGPRKTETYPQNQDSCIFGPNSGQNVVLARLISKNRRFKTGRNRGFRGLKIESDVYSILSEELWDRLIYRSEA